MASFALLSFGLSQLHWETWHLYDAIWMNLLGLTIAGVLWRLGSVRAIVRPERLVVRNLVRTHRIEWAQIVGVSFNPRMGEQYASLDLSDGQTLHVQAVQAADGPRAAAACTRLRRLADEYSRPAERPDDGI